MGILRTVWHFFFCILLRRYGPACFEIRDEVPLSKEPLRLDYLILRRLAEALAGAQTLHALWPLLTDVTIGELKSIRRPYEKGSLDRLWSYLHLYYASERKTLKDRRSLGAVLFVPHRTPSLDGDVKEMALGWSDLGGGYFRVTGGQFPLIVVELDEVSKLPGEDLLALYSNNTARTPRAKVFWGELRGAATKMDVTELDGYEEGLQDLLRVLTPEQALGAFTPEQRVAGLPPEQALGAFTPEQRVAGLPPEQVLGAFAPEQLLQALPDDILREMPDHIFEALPPDARAALRKRIGRT